jgi:hypothetical protein
LQFSCYTLDDLDTTTTVLSSVRFVKVETTFTYPEGTGQSQSGQSKDFMTQIYLQTNWNDISALQNNGSAVEFDSVMGQDTAIVQVDASHYLCAYTGSGDDGFALILTVDTAAGTVTCGTELEFDTTMGKTPALCQVDATHYLCAYQGISQDGYAVILTVDTSDWTITANTAVAFELNGMMSPDLCQVDSTHYLCAYEGDMDDGYAVILTVNTSTWEITFGSSLEYDNQDGRTPSLTQIDSTHYLCGYEGSSGAGKAMILIVDTSDWSISKKSPHTFDSNHILTPVLCAIDSTHHLCLWQGYADNDGNAVVLTVNTSTWTVSNEQFFEFEMQATEPALCKIDAETFLCACETQGNIGSAVILDVNLSDYSITRGEPYTFDEYAPDTSPDLCQIDSNNYLCSYTGDESDGWAVILCLGIRP